MHLAATAHRADQVDYVARELLSRTALLGRLVRRQSGSQMMRGEGGVLNSLDGAPRRITDLAQLEGLAQPTMTLLVKQLEQRGWVERERHVEDGRAVLISLTEEGRSALEELRRQVGEVLSKYVADLTDEQLAALETATDAMDSLIGSLQAAKNGNP
ncbi:MAG TPA: MarR family transcriptional regulator [Solirubrobacterales bacterium]|nr:MarR family transcriptional regulator [Solirubrobacterales bacterium]